jgi:hypothetical protein
MARSRSNEDHTVLRAGAHGALPRPGSKPLLVPFVPLRPYLGDEFSNHSGRQARDPPAADNCSASRVPHHTAMIADPELDVSPPTVHELVRLRPLIGP